MRLSAITDEISMDFEHALDVMLEYGVNAAELRSLWDKSIVDLTDDEIDRAKSALQKRCMTVSCIASPLLKCSLPRFESRAAGNTHQAKERGFADQRNLLERCLKLCGIFETDLIRVFSFWRSSPLTSEIEEEIVDSLKELASVAGESEVTLGLENEYACFVGTGEETARVISAVGSPYLKAVWDPGNALCAGESAFPHGYSKIRDYVAHVHVKDVVMNGTEPRFVLIGEGEIDYAGQFAALKNDGYTGFISLETHYNPGGSSEEGSRQCLSVLRELIAVP